MWPRIGASRPLSSPRWVVAVTIGGARLIVRIGTVSLFRASHVLAKDEVIHHALGSHATFVPLPRSTGADEHLGRAPPTPLGDAPSREIVLPGLIGRRRSLPR
jgi:hypothetical protein